MSSKNYNLMFWVMAAMLLCSCREFFYSDIPYTGADEDCHLITNSVVVKDNIARVFVNRSYFILDKNQYEESMISSGGLQDASVRMQVAGKWQDLSLYNAEAENVSERFVPCSERELGGSPERSELISGCYVTADSLKVSTGDTVRLHISHPVYGEAWATQIVPAEVQMTVKEVSRNKYNQILFDCTFAPYTGADDDVIILRLDSVLLSAYTIKRHFFSTDTTYLYNNRTLLYSSNPIFGYLHNAKTLSGYYGGREIYIRGAELRETKTVSCFVDYFIGESTTDLHIDTMYAAITTRSVTADCYLYAQSLASVRGYRASVQEPSSISSESNEGEYTITFDDLSEMVDELGSLEGTLLYTNFSQSERGGAAKGKQPLGLFGFASRSYKQEIIK